jgi:hypothetical protein
MMGYNTPPGNSGYIFLTKKENKDHNHAPKPVPDIATPSAVARYLEKWVEMLESDG